MRDAAAGLSAVDATAPKSIRASKAGLLATALVEPAGPPTVAPDEAVEPVTEPVTVAAEALDELAVLNALDVNRPADPLLGGRACSGGALDGSAAPDGTKTLNRTAEPAGTEAPDKLASADGTVLVAGTTPDGTNLSDGTLDESNTLDGKTQEELTERGATVYLCAYAIYRRTPQDTERTLARSRYSVHKRTS